MKQVTYPLVILLLLAFFPPLAESAEVLFLLDRSSSMDGEKLATAKQTLADLLRDVEAIEQNGLMIFGGSCQEAEMVIPLGGMPLDLETRLADISAQGSTPLTYALENAAGLFSDRLTERHIVLISDGEESCKGDPCQAVKALQEQGIQLKFHVIEFAKELSIRNLAERYREIHGKELPERLLERYRKRYTQKSSQLSCIADAGGGVYRQVKNIGGFSRALRSVHTRIQTGIVAPQPWLLEHFDGSDLAWQWEVLKPNPRHYRVRNGYLMITAARAGDLSTALVENTFRLRKSLPDKDWRATMQFTVNFQSQKELLFMGIYTDPDNYLAATLWAVAGCEGHCAQLNAELVNREQGRYQWHNSNIWQSPQTAEEAAFHEIMRSLPKPLTIRLAKQREVYVMSVRAGPEESTEWVALAPLMADGQDSAKFVFGFYQTAPVDTTRSMIEVDWIQIEPAGQ